MRVVRGMQYSLLHLKGWAQNRVRYCYTRLTISSVYSLDNVFTLPKLGALDGGGRSSMLHVTLTKYKCPLLLFLMHQF